MTLRNNWLTRRRLTWGSSEVGMLLLAYGLAPLNAKVPAWMRDGAEHYTRLGVPKVIAWKAGLVPRPSGDTKTMDKGNDVERRILTRWQFTIAHDHVDPRTIAHADSVPSQLLPLVDRACPAIAVSPDAWAFGHGPSATRDFVAVEVKGSRDEVDEPAWGYVQQTRTQMDAMHAARGVIVYGVHWLRDDIAEDQKRIVAFAVKPNPYETAMRYSVASQALRLVNALELLAPHVSTEGMNDIEKRRSLKSRKAAAEKCRDAWEESLERVQEWRDPNRDHIDDALSEVDDLESLLAAQSA